MLTNAGTLVHLVVLCAVSAHSDPITKLQFILISGQRRCHACRYSQTVGKGWSCRAAYMTLRPEMPASKGVVASAMHR